MKLIKYVFTGLVCLISATAVLAEEGETPIGPSIIEIIINLITGV